MKDNKRPFFCCLMSNLLILFLMIVMNQFTHAQVNYTLNEISDNNPDVYSFTLQGVSKNVNSFIAIFRDSILAPNVITDTDIKISGMPDEELDLIIGLDSIYSVDSKDDKIRSFELTKNHRKCTGIMYSGKEVSKVIKKNYEKNVIYLNVLTDISSSRTFNGMIIFLSSDLEWDFLRSY